LHSRHYPPTSVSSPPPSPPSSSRLLLLSPPGKLASPSSLKMISVLKGKCEHRSVPIGRGIMIGRDRACGIVLPWDGISRMHCKLEFRQSANGRAALWLCSHEALKAAPTGNGTFVNGRRVIESELSNGDKIEFGRGYHAQLGGGMREEDKEYVLQVTQLPSSARAQGRLKENFAVGTNFSEWSARVVPVQGEKENFDKVENSNRGAEEAERALNKMRFYDRRLMSSEGTLQAEMGLVAMNSRKSYRQNIGPEERELAGYTSGYGYM